MKELHRFRQFLTEGVLKEELTWYGIEDENEDIRFQNDEYLEEVGKKIKEIHPDISSEDLNKIIIMTGEQYSREEDFHGDSIPSGNFVKAAVEIYQTDVLGSDGYMIRILIDGLQRILMVIFQKIVYLQVGHRHNMMHIKKNHVNMKNILVGDHLI